MARMPKAEVVALAEADLVQGGEHVWRKVIDDAKAGNRGALDYLRGSYEPEPELEQPPFIGWRCERCGRQLPKTGYVWKYRWHNWKASGKETSGYYCDGCADAREAGGDW